MPTLNYPNTLSNDTLADADEVMANFNAARTLINGLLDASNIAAGAITSALIADGSIATGDIADNAITAAKIGADQVGSSEIAPDAVGTSEIAADSVGASEIAPGAVSNTEMAAGAALANLAADSVTAAKIAAGAVGTSELADDSVTSDKLNLTIQHAPATASIDITTSWTNVCGTSSPPAAGTYLLIGTLVWVQQVANNACSLRFSTDTDARASQVSTGSSRTDTMTIFAPGVVLNGSTNVQLQAQKGIAGASDDFQSLDDTSLGTTRLILVRYQ